LPGFRENRLPGDLVNRMAVGNYAVQVEYDPSYFGSLSRFIHAFIVARAFIVYSEVRPPEAH
jgi:hypothetical protein